jgi:hypothetical protein
MHLIIYFQKKPDILISVASFFRKCSVGLIFNPLGSLSLVKYPVLYIGSRFFQLLGRAYCSTLWLAIVLGVNPFLNTIFLFYRNCICFFFIFYCLFHIVYERSQQNFLLKTVRDFHFAKEFKTSCHKVYGITMATRLKRNWSKTQVSLLRV